MSELKTCADLAKMLLQQLYLDRAHALAQSQIDENPPRAVLMYAHELTQVDNVKRFLESVRRDGFNAGICAAISPVIDEADARTKSTEVKKVLEKLCGELRALTMDDPKA